MIPLFIMRNWKWLGLGLIALALIAAAWAHFAKDARTERKLADITAQAATVVLALREASDNPKASWSTAPGQIIALGESNRRLRGAIEEQNAAIDELAAEAVRMRADAQRLKQIADRAEAQRQSALRRLSDMSITPGTRTDCLTLLAEAETALDLVRETDK